MDQETKKPPTKLIEGVVVPMMFPDEPFRSAINYKPRKDDLFIVTYPKCGTTWMHNIVLLILRHGKPSTDPLDLFLGCPFLEMTGAEAVDYMKRPGAMKTHLPYHAMPKSDDAKYIFVCRNPKDCVVSLYYHMKGMPGSGYTELTFDEFFDLFVTGEVPYGDYFDHVKVWYEHRNDPNVHVVTYENLKKDIRGEVLKIAKFISEEYERVLLNDPKVLDDVIYYSSFDYMKKNTNDAMEKFMKGEIEPSFEGRPLPESLLKTIKALQSLGGDESKRKAQPAMQFVRKGIVGDWKNHLSPDQLRRLEERIEEKTGNGGVMNLWK